MKLVGDLPPETIARKVENFDPQVCSHTFLKELKGVLPSPEQVGKLNVYRNSDPAELAELHPSDRLMVQLIKIKRPLQRIEGMLYRVSFDEAWAALDEDARKLSDAGHDLLDAKYFKEMLSVRRPWLDFWVLTDVYLADSPHRKLHERHWYKGRRVWFPH